MTRMCGTKVFVLDVSPGFAVQLGVAVALLGEVLDEHFLKRVSFAVPRHGGGREFQSDSCYRNYEGGVV